MQVGFAGMGRMGREMAGNLARAEYDLVLWNRSRDRAEEVAAALGACVADTPRDLAERVDVVVTMLADDAASADVHFGEDGLFGAMGAKLYIEMGTMSPDHTAELAARAPLGVVVIDAPVSGATQAARDAQLLIMAGCDEATGAGARPLFDAMGRATVFLGDPGAGAAMKLGVNMLIHGLNQTLAEALALTHAAGIPREAAFGVIEQSAAAAPMLAYRKPLYLDDQAGEVSFTVALARKDMAEACALAESLVVAMPQSDITRTLLEEAIIAGYGDRDMASIVAFMQEKTS